jgi:plastocyanin
MRNRTLAAALLAAAFLVVGACESRTGGHVHRVEIRGMAYALPELTVAPGDTVVWVNRDIVPHTVTADGRQFDSGSISPSAEWSFVARERGRIPYTCTFHPLMKGVLLVK